MLCPGPKPRQMMNNINDNVQWGGGGGVGGVSGSKF